jgi:hypothetical protein
VLLSPSPDKAWLPGRAPWECAPNGAPPIPLELLNAVALPRHVGVDARLVFTETADGSLVAPGEPEEELVVRGCRYLLAMDYFSAALSGRWSTGQGAVGVGGGGGECGGGGGGGGGEGGGSGGGGGTGYSGSAGDARLIQVGKLEAAARREVRDEALSRALRRVADVLPRNILDAQTGPLGSDLASDHPLLLQLLLGPGFADGLPVMEPLPLASAAPAAAAAPAPSPPPPAPAAPPSLPGALPAPAAA